MITNISKVILFAFLGIVIMSEAQFAPGIMVKSVCINGYEYVITYPLKWTMGSPIPAEAQTSVVQVYENSPYDKTQIPRKCNFK